MLKTLRTSYKECPVKIKRKEYLEITKGFMEFIMEQVIEEAKEVKLPAGCGTLKVVGRKIVPKVDENGEITNLAPDWVKTKKLWEENPEAKKEKRLVHHFNDHTNGVSYRLEWCKTILGLANKNYYGFIAARQHKRKIHTNIITGKEYLIQELKEKKNGKDT